MVLNVVALLLYRGLIVIFLITNTESFSFGIFGEDIDKPAEKFDSAGKFKCFSTYELVEVLKYDIHYDEVRFSTQFYIQLLYRPHFGT
jgi:hypothetical protein